MQRVGILNLVDLLAPVKKRLEGVRDAVLRGVKICRVRSRLGRQRNREDCRKNNSNKKALGPHVDAKPREGNDPSLKVLKVGGVGPHRRIEEGKQTNGYEIPLEEVVGDLTPLPCKRSNQSSYKRYEALHFPFSSAERVLDSVAGISTAVLFDVVKFPLTAPLPCLPFSHLQICHNHFLNLNSNISVPSELFRSPGEAHTERCGCSQDPHSIPRDA